MRIKKDEMSVKGILNGAVKTLWAIVGTMAVTLSAIVSYNWDEVKNTISNTADAVQMLSIQVAEANKNMEHVIYITEENKIANKEQDERIGKNEDDIKENEYKIDRLNKKVFPMGF